MIAGVAVPYVTVIPALESAVAPVPDVPPSTRIEYASAAAPVTASAHVAAASEPKRRMLTASGAVVNEVPTAVGLRSVMM